MTKGTREEGLVTVDLSDDLIEMAEGQMCVAQKTLGATTIHRTPDGELVQTQIRLFIVLEESVVQVIQAALDHHYLKHPNLPRN